MKKYKQYNFYGESKKQETKIQVNFVLKTKPFLGYNIGDFLTIFQDLSTRM